MLTSLIYYYIHDILYKCGIVAYLHVLTYTCNNIFYVKNNKWQPFKYVAFNEPAYSSSDMIIFFFFGMIWLLSLVSSSLSISLTSTFFRSTKNLKIEAKENIGNKLLTALIDKLSIFFPWFIAITLDISSALCRALMLDLHLLFLYWFITIALALGISSLALRRALALNLHLIFSYNNFYNKKRSKLWKK